MLSVPLLKKLITTAIIISFFASFLNQMGILQYPLGASSGTVWNIGVIIWLVFTILAIRLVLMIPEK